MLRLRDVLAETPIDRPRIPVVHNAHLQCHFEPDDIRSALANQLITPVRWSATIEKLIASGTSLLVEPGPGRVLTGLHRRISRDLDATCVHDDDSLSAALSLAKEKT